MALTGAIQAGANAYRSLGRRRNGLGRVGGYSGGVGGSSSAPNRYSNFSDWGAAAQNNSAFADETGGALGGAIGGVTPTKQPGEDLAASLGRITTGSGQLGQIGSQSKSYSGGPGGVFGGPANNIAGTAYGAASGMSGLLGNYNYYASMYGPQMAQLMVSQAGLYGNYGLQMGQQGLTQQGLYADHKYGMANADLDLKALGLDRQDIQLGFKGNQVDRDYFNRIKLIAGAQLDNRLIDLMRQGVMDTKHNNSKFTGSGGFFAPGRQVENTDIYQKTKLAGDSERLAHQRELAGIDKNLSHLDIDDEKLRIADQKLGVAAEKIGLRKDQLTSALQLGLQGLGLDSQAALANLLEGLASNNAAQQQIAMQIIQQAIGASQGFFGPGGPTQLAGNAYAQLGGG